MSDTLFRLCAKAIFAAFSVTGYNCNLWQRANYTLFAVLGGVHVAVAAQDISEFGEVWTETNSIQLHSGGGGGNRTRVRQPIVPRRYMLSSLLVLRAPETVNAPRPNPSDI